MSLSAVAIPTVNSQPENIQILNNHSAHINPYSEYFHVQGEVQNVGTTVRNNVRVMGNLYNKTGGVITAWQREIYADHLLPNKKLPLK